jgi:hypothetical protein
MGIPKFWFSTTLNSELPMRHAYPTSAAAVYPLAQQALAKVLVGQPFRPSVTLTQLLDLLLLMAATTRTLFAVTQRYFPFSHETARQALHAHLPKTDRLTERLVQALYDVLALARRDRRRLWTVAIDTHSLPYYGARSTAGIIGGQKKQGSKSFFSYATAILLHRRRRYTIGLLPLTKSTRPHQIVAALLDQIATHGLLVGGVVLDSGFDSGETLLLLQKRKLSYTVPLRRKGRGPNRRNTCFAWPHGTIDSVSWVTETSRKPVTTRVLVWQRPGQPQAKVYAFAGWGVATAVAEARRAWLGRRRYRQRFGIETSYRQKNQARGWTTSRSVAYRLLLEGVAYLLRQLWVRLSEVVARSECRKPTAWVPLRLVDLLESLAERLKSAYPPTPASFAAASP